MPFKIVRNDLTRMEADAIVNSANPMPTYGGGTDAAVYRAAGEEALLKERRKIGNLKPGQAAITPGYALKARWIIHTAGPVWRGGGFGEEEELAACYKNSLRLARRHRCRSIAFPLISTGVYGFPKDKALRIALDCFEAFLMKEEMEIYLVVFDSKAVLLSQQLMRSIDSYIDDRYVREKKEEEYLTGPFAEENFRRSADRMDQGPEREQAEASSFREPQAWNASPQRLQERFPGYGQPQAKPSAGSRFPGFSSRKKEGRSLDELMGLREETFQQMLLRLIREKGMKNAEVYKRAGLDKRLFAKIKANEAYAPKKSTALLLALALKLSLDETLDLIGRAGYAFSPSSKQDLVVRYFIENGKYDIYELEIVLFDYGLDPLGSYD